MKNDKVDVCATSEAIHNMADTMRYFALELDKIADRMVEAGDLSYGGEALGCVSNCMLNLRLDLLVTRPVREYEKVVSKICK